MEEKKITEYLIPSNVSIKFEFIEGFGWKELRSVVVAVAIGFLIYMLLGLIPKTEYIKKDSAEGYQYLANFSEDELDTIEYDDKGDIVVHGNLIASPIRLIVVVLFGGTAFALVRRSPITGLSIMSTLDMAIKFKKKQKLYLYKYNSATEEVKK